MPQSSLPQSPTYSRVVHLHLVTHSSLVGQVHLLHPGDLEGVLHTRVGAFQGNLVVALLPRVVHLPLGLDLAVHLYQPLVVLLYQHLVVPLYPALDVRPYLLSTSHFLFLGSYIGAGSATLHHVAPKVDSPPYSYSPLVSPTSCQVHSRSQTARVVTPGYHCHAHFPSPNFL